MNEESQQLAPNEGLARLFPLPNLVLFPHVVQPLHIFEPRYRQLMADSLADDRRFAMALLRPNWEQDYHKSPPIHSTVCLGQIHREERLIDGRYNLLLQGLRRARIVQEVPTDRLYRTAHVRWIEDLPPPATHVGPLEEALAHLLTRWASGNQADEAVENLLRQQLPLATLSDVLAFSLPLPLETRQELLEHCCVETRVRRLLTYLEEQLPPGERPPRRPFPPHFSAN